MILTRGGTHALASPACCALSDRFPAMAAIAFYGTVFGAKQRALMPAFDGLRIMHCELEINGGSVMLSDAFSEFGHTRVPLPGELATVSVSLEYAEAKMVDDIFAKATSLGAKGETNPMNSFWAPGSRRFRSLRSPLDLERPSYLKHARSLAAA